MYAIIHTLQKYSVLSERPEILQAFDFIVHGPTLCVLLLFFYERIKLFLIYLARNVQYALHYLLLGFVVELITLIFFLVIKKMSLGSFPVWIGFTITTICLLSERFIPEQRASTSWNFSKALLLGCAQGLAFLPGISRLGITFATARWCGFSRRHAFEISFLIEAPISAAAFCKGIMDLSTAGALNLLNYKTYLIMVIAGGIALKILHRIYTMVNEAKWWLFGCYTFVCAMVSFMLRD